jgi:translation initiation factor 1
MHRRCAVMGGLAVEHPMGKGGWQEFSRAESLQRLSGPAGGPTPKAAQRVRVQRTRAGKGGKLVTAITGLEIPEAEARALLKRLKAGAGTGGTLKDGVIELQGDHVATTLEALTQEGFRPKQAGG